jgi:hypothetical protein
VRSDPRGDAYQRGYAAGYQHDITETHPPYGLTPPGFTAGWWSGYGDWYFDTWKALDPEGVAPAWTRRAASAVQP